MYFPNRERKKSSKIDRIQESLLKIRSLKINPCNDGARQPASRRGSNSEQTFGNSIRRDTNNSFENSSFCDGFQRRKEEVSRKLFNSIEASPVVEESSASNCSPTESPVGIRVINSYKAYKEENELRQPVTSVINRKTHTRYQIRSVTPEEFNPDTPEEPTDKAKFICKPSNT